MALTIELDTQRYLPWLEQVTYTVAGTPERDVTMARAAQYDVTFREMAASNGVYQAGDMVWTLAHDEVDAAGIAPKPRDRITDAGGTVFTVLNKADTTLMGFYKLVTRALAIAADLCDRITIQLPVVGAGATGAASLTYAPAYASLPARVQPDETEDTDEHGRAGTRTRYLVYLDRRLVPRNAAGTWGRVVLESDTLFLPAGSILDVRSYRDAERITDLPVLECVSVP